ncbi:MAG: biotin/lipoyl-containing protein [Desulfatitalea sp.]
MEYTLRINDRPMTFQVEAAADEQWTVTTADGAFPVAYNIVSSHQLHLRIGQAALTAYLFEEQGRTLVAIDGQIYRVQEQEDATGLPSDSAEAQQHSKTVTPPMPAVVVRVLIQAGDAVAKGQPLVVLSAMKMETTLGAPFAGRVAAVNTVEGAKVMPGDLLVELAAIEEGTCTHDQTG